MPPVPRKGSGNEGAAGSCQHGDVRHRGQRQTSAIGRDKPDGEKLNGERPTEGLA